MLLIIILGIFISVVVLIFVSIQNIRYMKRPLDYNESEAKNRILYVAAFTIVTMDMTNIQIYKQRGNGIRTPVERKIQEKAQHIQEAYTDSKYVALLQEKGLVSKEMKIRANMCENAGKLLSSFLINQNKTTMDEGITPTYFFNLRRNSPFNIPGVYILYNKNKGKYYVGQATKLSFRINQHFTGHGNGDVYADYKYGDDFLIKWIPLKNSGFCDLNSLEKHNILKYNAVNSGYNKTVGNN